MNRIIIVTRKKINQEIVRSGSGKQKRLRLILKIIYSLFKFRTQV